MATYGGPDWLGFFEGPDDYDLAYRQAVELYGARLPAPDEDGNPYLCMDQAKCEHCGSVEDVQEEGSRTAYSPKHLNVWEKLLLPGEGLYGTPPDPNASSWLCRPCAKDHEEYWNEMWSYAHG